MFKAHTLLYHSTLGSRVIKKKKKVKPEVRAHLRKRRPALLPSSFQKRCFEIRFSHVNISQSLPDSGFGFQVKVVRRIRVVPGSLDSGQGSGPPAARRRIGVLPRL